MDRQITLMWRSKIRDGRMALCLWWGSNALCFCLAETLRDLSWDTKLSHCLFHILQQLQRSHEIHFWQFNFSWIVCGFPKLFRSVVLPFDSSHSTQNVIFINLSALDRTSMWWDGMDEVIWMCSRFKRPKAPGRILQTWKIIIFFNLVFINQM